MGKKLTTEQFIARAISKHGDRYTYDKCIYVDNYTSVIITCPEHGDFTQTPNKHIRGRGCRECTNNRTFTTEEFITKAESVHGNRYDYSESVYTRTRDKIDIICKIHGKFSQLARHHVEGRGCPKCNNSKGEDSIMIFLNENNISYIREKIFNECKHERVLPFDFYLPDHNLCIEYDGEHHYNTYKHFGGEDRLHLTQHRDSIKTQYCIDNNIQLLRIPYWDFNNIKEILERELK